MFKANQRSLEVKLIRKISPFILIGIFLAACTAAGTQAGEMPTSEPAVQTRQSVPTSPAATAAQLNLPDLGPAPELENQVWLNTDHPLHIRDLGGKVILLEMWTFDCINCRDVIPSLRGWYQKYSPQGLVIIGNHYPEFDFEKDLANLKEAIQKLDIPYPVAQDNDGKTWSAYHNNYWPTAYLIDKRGHIRFIQIGEGNYEHTEAVIQDLLSEASPQ
jgi:thiol-disulfide isomerase/thioredoxin